MTAHELGHVIDDFAGSQAMYLGGVPYRTQLDLTQAAARAEEEARKKARTSRDWKAVGGDGS